MDETDVRIFAEMGFEHFSYGGKNRRPSPKEIGRKLGIDEKTVRTRVGKMEREGFIQEYRAIPNPTLFGLPFLCTCGFRLPDILTKNLVAQKLLAAQSVLDITDLLGLTVGVTFAASSHEDGEQKTRWFAERIGLSSFPFIPPSRFPVVTMTPSRLDWQIILALRPDPLRSVKEIASELGITYRNAEYRITRLLASRAVFLRAFTKGDPKGIVFYSLFLSLKPEDQELVKHNLRDRYKNWVFREYSPSGPVFRMSLFSTSVGEAEDKLLDALSQVGVTGGDLTIIKRCIEPTLPSWIDRMLEKKILAS